MKRFGRKISAILLVLCMVLSDVSTVAFAEDEGVESYTQEQQVTGDSAPSDEDFGDEEEFGQEQEETSELEQEEEALQPADVAEESELNSLGYYQYYDEGAQRFESREIPKNAIRFSEITPGPEMVVIGEYRKNTTYVLDQNWGKGYESSLYVKGNVSLILMDGCTMNVTSVRVDCERYSTAPCSIRIYAQENGTGTLIADNNKRFYRDNIGCAGIGGSGDGDLPDGIYDHNAGDIYIYGGKITAKGGPKAAGIGGSGREGKNNCNAGNITIRGGEIEAVGGTGFSGGCGAGIGGGNSGNAKNITISGGTIHASSVPRSFMDFEAAAAIGCGAMEHGTVLGGYFDNITISGGTITAESSGAGAAIGGGYKTSRGERTIRITGGHITANADARRGGYDQEVAAGIGGGYQSSGIKIFISGSDTEITAIGATETAIGTPDKKANIEISNNFDCYAGKDVNNLIYAPDSVNGVKNNKTATLIQGPPPVDYVNEKGENATCERYRKIESGMKLLDDSIKQGWYVVDDNVIYNDQIRVRGDVKLILKDNSALSALNGILFDKNQRTRLTIYGQLGQTGQLKAVNTWLGIGGIESQGSEIIINGGQISAQGKVGIGFRNGRNNVVTINRGTVDAECIRGMGAGIGFERSSNSTLTISGGTVKGLCNTGGVGIGAVACKNTGVDINNGNITVRSNTYPGIGFAKSNTDFSPDTNSNNSITINGGTVDATSNRIGIGGDSCKNTRVTINNGNITARGSSGRSGIGFVEGSSNSIIINDGTVEATSNDVGIGCENVRTLRELTINGGKIKAIGKRAIGSTDGDMSNKITIKPQKVLVGNTEGEALAKTYVEPARIKSAVQSNKTALINYDRQMPWVPYINEEGGTVTCESYRYIESDTQVLDDRAANGWYVVDHNVSLNALQVNGRVRVILVDGFTLTVDGEITLNNTLDEFMVYGQPDHSGRINATGIGGQRDINEARIGFYGGQINVTASGIGFYGGSKHEIAIDRASVTAAGGIYGNDTQKMNITIKGGTVNAAALRDAPGIGFLNGSDNHIDITGGIITAEGSGNCPGIGANVDSSIGSINLKPEKPDSRLKAVGGRNRAIGVERGNLGNKLVVDSNRVLVGTSQAEAQKTPYLDRKDNEEGVQNNKVALINYESQRPQVSYVNEEGTDAICRYYKKIEPGMTNLDDKDTVTKGWYVADQDISLNALQVNGDVRIILINGHTLTVKGAISLNGSNAGLTVYGQKGHTGKLNASGINGRRNINGARIGFYGGQINVTGSGIGFDRGSNNIIVIDRATVTVTGGIHGNDTRKMNITIKGGIVNINRGYLGIGFSGGSGNSLDITGGMVTAAGDLAGIGGRFTEKARITIAGGTVNAACTGYNGPGIGYNYGLDNRINITDGNISAKGSGSCPGIGADNSIMVREIRIKLENPDSRLKAVGGRNIAIGVWGGNLGKKLVVDSDRVLVGSTPEDAENSPYLAPSENNRSVQKNKVALINYESKYVPNLQTVTIGSQMTMNFHTRIPEEGRNAGGQMTFTISGRNSSPVTVPFTVVQGKPDESGRYIFSCPFRPDQMADLIGATYTYYVKGQKKTIRYELMTVEAYLVTCQNSVDLSDQEKALMEAIGKYGYNAQHELQSLGRWTFGPRPLQHREITHFSEPAKGPASYDIYKENYENLPGDIRTNFALVYEPGLGFNFYITDGPRHQAVSMKATVTLGGKTLKSNVAKVGRRWQINIADIPVQNWGDPVQTTVTETFRNGTTRTWTMEAPVLARGKYINARQYWTRRAVDALYELNQKALAIYEKE